MVEPHFLDFPFEILENIIRFMDGKTLVNLSRVSPALNDITNHPSHETMKVWKRICYTELNRDFLIETLQTLYPSYWVNDSEVEWNIVYRNVCRWENLSEWTSSLEAVKRESYEITCLFVSGDWLLIGTQKRGSVVAFNLKTEERVLLYKGADVIDFQVHTLEQPEYPEKELLVGVCHDEALLYLSACWDVKLNVRTGAVSKVVSSKCGKLVRYFEGKEAKLSELRTGVPFVLSFSEGGKEWSPHLFMNTFSSRNLGILDFWRDRVALADFEARKMKVLDVENLKEMEVKMSYLPSAFAPATSIFIWHSSVIIAILEGQHSGGIEILTEGRREIFSPYERWGGLSPTCFLYHCGTLFVASDTGTVLCFRVDSDSQLLRLGSLEPLWRVDVCEERIVALAVKDSLEEKPKLLLSTRESVYQLSFSSDSSVKKF